MDAPEQLEDLSEKDLLLEMLVELKTIRYGLQTGDFGADEREQDDQPTLYECDLCPKTVPEDEREHHLRTQHGGLEGMPVEGEFSEL